MATCLSRVWKPTGIAQIILIWRFLGMILDTWSINIFQNLGYSMVHSRNCKSKLKYTSMCCDNFVKQTGLELAIFEWHIEMLKHQWVVQMERFLYILLMNIFRTRFSIQKCFTYWDFYLSILPKNWLINVMWSVKTRHMSQKVKLQNKGN